MSLNSSLRDIIVIYQIFKTAIRKENANVFDVLVESIHL